MALRLQPINRGNNGTRSLHVDALAGAHLIVADRMINQDFTVGLGLSPQLRHRDRLPKLRTPELGIDSKGQRLTKNRGRITKVERRIGLDADEIRQLHDLPAPGRHAMIRTYL